MESIFLPSSGAWNIYHFLIYIFTTLINVHTEPENIYIDMTNPYFEKNHNFVIELLKIKYPKSNIINCSTPPSHVISLDQLPYIHDLNNNNHIEYRYRLYNFIHNTFIDNVKAISYDIKTRYSKKIYISRKDTPYRNITNEAEVIEYLEPLGFQSLTLTNIPLLEQFAIFYNADIIIAVCGAALTNIIFCNPTTKIIEICSSRLCLEKHFEDISNCFKINYSRYLNTSIIKSIDSMADHLFINDIESINN